MAIYEIQSDHIRKIDETSFGAAGVRERGDLQRLLRNQIEIVSPDTPILIIAEEFGGWEDSKRRIDLLGLDRNASLVVIELKRTEDGGHMELQAIRYAAMVSAMAFDKAVEVYADYLTPNGNATEARATILRFLDWEEPDEDRFAQDVRIILASAEFSKELTTAVIWLNDRGLDIRCVRIKPYRDNGRILVDVQQVIPLPEAAEYQVKLSEKNRKERLARKSQRDYTKYDVTINGDTETRLPKRSAVFRVVKHLCSVGVSPKTLARLCELENLFYSVDGEVDAATFAQKGTSEAEKAGKRFDASRYFCDEADLIRCEGRTYAMSNQWGIQTGDVIRRLLDEFPDKGCSCRASQAM